MDEICRELQAVAGQQPEQKLSPASVVQFAKRNKESATYRWLANKGCFDAKRAQNQFALLMAQTLIRHVTVRVQQGESEPVKVRAFVSLSADRRAGGGYRQVESVLGSADLRAQMVATVRKELVAIQMKYNHLVELKGVWDAIGKLDGNNTTD